jgi:hypothetical protein
VPLRVEPALASWDPAQSSSQVRLATFLDHVEACAEPLISRVVGAAVVELTIGLPPEVALISGGRDLDNYLYPLARRLGPHRLAAAFARKMHGSSHLAVDRAEPEPFTTAAAFTTRMSGSYEHREWKITLRDRLLQAGVDPAPPGPVALEVVIVTGPGRSWPNLWKPLLDAFGPVLGEEPGRPFHPYDDRITVLGIHHDLSPDLANDVIIKAWWTPAH